MFLAVDVSICDKSTVANELHPSNMLEKSETSLESTWDKFTDVRLISP